MPLMRETLAQFLRRKRQPIGWERMKASTGLQERTMRNYELGRMPPLDVGLKIGEALGVTLEELAEAALGRPYKRKDPPGSPEVGTNGAGSDPVDRHAAMLETGEKASERKDAPATPRQRPRRSPPSR